MDASAQSFGRGVPCVQKLDRDQMEAISGILSQHLFPRPTVVDTPFTAAWDVIEPGQGCVPHHHHDGEILFVIEGLGRVTIKDIEVDVEPGDAVYLPPLDTHEIRNDSGVRFVYLTVYWTDMKLLNTAVDSQVMSQLTTNTGGRPVLTVGSPPTPNGPLHLGHIAGPYLAADVYRRYAALKGQPAFTLFGVDEHNSFVASRAAQLGESPQATAGRFCTEIVQAIEHLALGRDVFARPSTSDFVTATFEQLFKQLLSDGYVVRATRNCLYCDNEERFLFDADATGACPICGTAASAAGCEACGEPFSPDELRSPMCTLCGETATEEPLERLFFRLAPFSERLSDYHRRTAMNPRLRSFCSRIISKGLPDVPLTYLSDWGLPVPLDGFEDQRFISAFSCGVSWYLGATKQMLRDVSNPLEMDSFWGKKKGTVAQFFGWDNAFLHAIVYPGMMLAFAPDMEPPRALISNEMYRLDGEKFSTSRHHAVWVNEFAHQYSKDAIRLYLALTRPEVEETSFSIPEFETFLKTILVDEWDTLLLNVSESLNEHFNGVAPDAGEWSAQLADFHIDLRSIADRIERGYQLNSFSPSLATQSACELVRRTLRFTADCAPLFPSPEFFNEVRTAMALQLLALKTLAVQISPIAPGYASKLWHSLGEAEPIDHALHGKKVAELPFVRPASQIQDLATVSFSGGSRRQDLLMPLDEAPISR